MTVESSQLSHKREIESHRFIFVLALLIIFIMAARTPLDTDMWWHLRAGQVMVQTGQPMLSDQFWFTRFGQAWINHSWLSEVILYLCFRAGSYLGLGLFVAVLVTASMALLFIEMDGPAIFRAFVLVLAGIIFSLVWSPRPQILSLFFFALTAYVIFLYKWRKINRLWWLNSHFYFLVERPWRVYSWIYPPGVCNRWRAF